MIRILSHYSSVFIKYLCTLKKPTDRTDEKRIET